MVLGISLNADSLFATGGSILTGQFVAAVQRQTGALLWETSLAGSNVDLFDYQLGGRKLVASSSARVFVAGHNADDSAQVASLDAASGSLDWQTNFPSNGPDINRPQSLQLDAATGALFVAGQRSTVSDDAWVANLASGSGAVTWETTVDGTANSSDRVRALGVSAASVYAAGMLTGVGTNSDIWVKQLDK